MFPHPRRSYFGSPVRIVVTSAPGAPPTRHTLEWANFAITCLSAMGVILLGIAGMLFQARHHEAERVRAEEKVKYEQQTYVIRPAVRSLLRFDQELQATIHIIRHFSGRSTTDYGETLRAQGERLETAARSLAVLGTPITKTIQLPTARGRPPFRHASKAKTFDVELVTGALLVSEGCQAVGMVVKDKFGKSQEYFKRIGAELDAAAVKSLSDRTPFDTLFARVSIAFNRMRGTLEYSRENGFAMIPIDPMTAAAWESWWESPFDPRFVEAVDLETTLQSLHMSVLNCLASIVKTHPETALELIAFEERLDSPRQNGDVVVGTNAIR